MFHDVLVLEEPVSLEIGMALLPPICRYFVSPKSDCPFNEGQTYSIREHSSIEEIQRSHSDGP